MTRRELTAFFLAPLGAAGLRYVYGKYQVDIKAGVIGAILLATVLLTRKENIKMAEQKGIQNIKEWFDFGFAIEQAGVKLFEGGKFHFEALGEILKIVPTVGPAFNNGADAIAELMNVSEAEAEEMVEYVASKGVLPTKAVEVLRRALRIGVKAWDLIGEFRELPGVLKSTPSTPVQG